jgi:hypothetical protein
VELDEPVAPGRAHPKRTIIQASNAQMTVGHVLPWDRILFSFCWWQNYALTALRAI